MAKSTIEAIKTNKTVMVMGSQIRLTRTKTETTIRANPFKKEKRSQINDYNRLPVGGAISPFPEELDQFLSLQNSGIRSEMGVEGEQTVSTPPTQ